MIKICFLRIKQKRIDFIKIFFHIIVGLDKLHIWCHLTDLVSLTVKKIPMVSMVSGTHCIEFIYLLDYKS